jgi:hypothetical protein
MKTTIQKTLFKARYFKLLLIVISVLFCSYAQGQTLADRFLEKQNDTTSNDVVYLAFTDSIFHTDLNDVVSKANDSIMLQMYKQMLVSTLSYLGLTVVQVSSQDLPAYASKIDSRHNTLEVAQLELQYFTQDDTLIYDQNPTIVFTKQIGGLRFSSWLIYDEKDSTSTLTFYSEEDLIDYFDGQITRQGNNYNAIYDYKAVNPNDAYQASFNAGKKSAQYFFNFLMNKYVWLNTKDKSKVSTYYSISPYSKDIYYSREPIDNFDIIPQDQTKKE